MYENSEGRARPSPSPDANAHGDKLGQMVMDANWRRINTLYSLSNRILIQKLRPKNA